MLQMRKKGVIQRWALLREKGFLKFLLLWATCFGPIFGVVLTINIFRFNRTNDWLGIQLTIAITLACIILGSIGTWLIQEYRYKRRVTG